MKTYTQQQIAHKVTIDGKSLAIIEAAFAALGRDQVTMPDILSMDIAENNGEVDVKTAHIKGWKQFAIKISPGFFNNPSIGLPSLNGLMVLFNAHTGLVDAVLFDEGYLTDVRTALAGALASQYLALSNAHHVAVVGAGAQARLQVEALLLVRPITHLSVYARDPHKAQLFSQQMATDFGLVTNACSSVKAACKQAQILITTTASTSPLVTLDDLPAGIHITAIGSDNPHKRELDKHLVTSADLLVVDQITQSQTMGELKKIPIESLTILTLGKLIAQQQYPRINEQQISLCDLTGTGVQDTAIACHAAQCLEPH
jgi:ectoine utilization protein EutC